MILIYYASRAEKSILDPIKAELDHRDIDNLYIDLSQCVKNIDNDKNLSKVYDYVFEQVENCKNIKHAIVIGDRREAMFVSLALFVKQISIIQLASGDLSETNATVDDYFRHLITILSNKQICFTEKSKRNSDLLLKCLNLDVDSGYFANPTLSNINIDIINKSEYIYDLILIHPQSLSRKDTFDDMNEVLSLITNNKKTIIIRGNKDKNFDILYNAWDDLDKNNGNITIFDNLEKQAFIEVLANCDRFITNSSCSFYEAPLLLKEKRIIRVGNRNKNREIARYTIDDLRSAGKIINFILE